MKRYVFPRNGSRLLYTVLLSVVTLFAACSDNDEPDFAAGTFYPAEGTDGAFLVDAWAAEYTIDIISDGEWQVQTDSRFVEISPSSGTGNATITFTVQANQSERRKYAYLDVIFPGHEELNQEIEIEQKWSGDYDENAADKLESSNRVYAVGYSYDATREYANPSSVRMEIFDTQKMIKNGVLVTGPTQVELTETTITGSSISEVTNALAVKADVSGGFGKFKAEASASFDMNNAQTSNYEYAITYFDLTTRTAVLQKNTSTLISDYMLDDAYKAINGENVIGRDGQEYPTDYPSTKNGFKKLVEDYGTHVVVSAKLGGRVRLSLEVDITNITSSYDIKAFAKASYEGAFVSASGSVDEKFKQSYEENRQSITTRVNVLGGDQSLAVNLGDVGKGGFSKDNLSAWRQSVKDENMTLMGFEKGSIIPLYEVVHKQKYPERYEALKAYIEGDEIAQDFSTYDCGTVTEFAIPTFSSNEQSLVREVTIGNQLIGQICNEYIPNIDRKNRVTVVYPVIGTTVRYNMGFFIGNKTHKPARVSWDGDDVAIQEYPDLDFGSVNKLYLRGASVSAKLTEGTRAISGDVENKLLEGPQRSYGLVKIFGHLWTREDYQDTKLSDGKDMQSGNLRYADVSGTGKNKVFYLVSQIVASTFPPKGWKVPSSDDYKAIENKLVANNISQVGKAFLSDGVLGFNAELAGWFDPTNKWISFNLEQGEYITSNRRHVRIRKEGGFEIGTVSFATWASARFIRE